MHLHRIEILGPGPRCGPDHVRDHRIDDRLGRVDLCEGKMTNPGADWGPANVSFSAIA